MKTSIIVAAADNGVIGQDGGLPWRLPPDLRHFKSVTMAKAIIMGRRTYDSIGHALRGRRNIVVTRNPDFAEKDVERAGSFEEALAIANDGRSPVPESGEAEIMVIGGAEIYRAALPVSDRIYLTQVHIEAQGDTRLPNINWSEWREVSREEFEPDGGLPGYGFFVFERLTGSPEHTVLAK